MSGSEGPRLLLGSASQLDRTLACPSSHQLPQDEFPPGEAAEFGTAVHDCLEHPEDPERYLQHREEWHKWLRTIPYEATAAPSLRAENRETAFVYHGATRTATAVKRDTQSGHREYPTTDVRDVPGTADWAVAGYWALEIGDYKTGKWLPNPEDSTQLKHLAMAARKAVAPSARRVVVGFQRVRLDKRRKPEDAWTVANEVAVFGPFELDAHEHRVQQALVAAQRARDAVEAGEEPEVNPGQHCRFCPARKYCPQQDAAEAALKRW